MVELGGVYTWLGIICDRKANGTIPFRSLSTCGEPANLSDLATVLLAGPANAQLAGGSEPVGSGSARCGG
jgi:hypothetical protein